MPALTVVRGTDCIATEDDGLTWAVVSTLPATIASGARGAGFGGAYYVSDGSVSLRSTDGVNWVTAGNHGFSVPVPILYNGSVFVATNTSSSHVARSTDGGQTWSAPIAVPIPPNVPGVIGTTFCIMRSSNGNRATSADGLTWSSGAGGVIVFAGHTTTSFSRNRIVHAGAPGQALGSAFTSDGLSWTSGGVIGTLGDLAFNGVACSETGSAVVIGSQAGTGTFRSADGGVSWSPKVDTANFQTTSAGPVWVGSANTFIIPLATGGICERTTDGGASWSTIPNPGSLNIVTHQTAMFVLPGGLPGPEEAFWTNRILTQEVI